MLLKVSSDLHRIFIGRSLDREAFALNMRRFFGELDAQLQGFTGLVQGIGSVSDWMRL